MQSAVIYKINSYLFFSFYLLKSAIKGTKPAIADFVYIVPGFK
ncbi:hypothetical protein COO91_06997 [Nostoc flagelliforme CCNUN1]|uniref:Uncharacterized protein n=1 Tax=Nostoc flagelliforme CCNUN1 TaxID=2038116 RepID=A0A2K8SZV1_9NOSO|nr:hypothetical protein COO91_06997 [Nostoc flagelliforme CCNUN1]